MRWKISQVGDTRTRWVFPLLPKRTVINGEAWTIWLEWILVTESYVRTRNERVWQEQRVQFSEEVFSYE